MSKRHQQGDLKLTPVSIVPEGAKRLSSRAGRYVLAEGEATGHAHTIEECPEVEMYERDGTLFLRTAGPATIEHQEHAAQIVEPGIYEVGRVLEYDYLKEQARMVLD